MSTELSKIIYRIMREHLNGNSDLSCTIKQCFKFTLFWSRLHRNKIYYINMIAVFQFTLTENCFDITCFILRQVTDIPKKIQSASLLPAGSTLETCISLSFRRSKARDTL